jgi:Zn-dependent protease/predicted transcriptional regulator
MRWTISLPLGKIHGIRVRLHWSWIIIFVLLTWSLAVGYFPQTFKSWSAGEYWGVSVVAALLLFLSVLLHELSHSFVAQAHGLEVPSITLHLFGGAAAIAREPRSPAEELWMTGAGPLSSIVIGAAFLGLHFLLPRPDWLTATFGYLGVINLLLAAFNLIPAFPLDGGRILRSLIWAATQDYRRATRVATRVGAWIAASFIMLGVWEAVTVDIVSGIWMALIGWFLFNMATMASRQDVFTATFHAVSVGEVMTTPDLVDSGMMLVNAVYDHLLHQPQSVLGVVDDGEFQGLLTASNVRRYRPREWPFVRVRDAMLPAARLRVVSQDTTLVDAIALMAQLDLPEIPVLEDRHIVGLLTASTVDHYIRLRSQLGLDSNLFTDERHAA